MYNMRNNYLLNNPFSVCVIKIFWSRTGSKNTDKTILKQDAKNAVRNKAGIQAKEIKA